MNKQVYSLLLTTSIMFSAPLMGAANPFGALTRTITTSAQTWITNFVSKLDINYQLYYLNLFINPSLSSPEAVIKCMQLIQAEPSLKATSDELEKNMQNPLEMYITNMQKKFESIKQTSQKAVQEFMKKLEQKIYELITHFYGIYYAELYKHIEKQDPALLFYMFDEKGEVIPMNKRIKPLPKPTV